MTDEPNLARSGAADLAQLFRQRLMIQGHAPFLTFYDDGSGERTELSYATFDNWVAKTANLLAMELDAGPGSQVAVATGTHWTMPVIAFAAWRAGAAVALLDDPGRGDGIAAEIAAAGADAVFVREEALGAALDAVAPERTVAVGAGLGARLTVDPGGALGFGDDVPAFGDHFDDLAGEPGRAALVLGSGGGAVVVPASPGDAAAAGVVTVEELFGIAAALAAQGLTERDRVLCAGEPADVLALGCFGSFHAGGSTVLVRDPAAGLIARKLRDERVTLVLAGHPALDDLPGSELGDHGQPEVRALPGRLGDWR